jgi:hypothetical protein
MNKTFAIIAICLLAACSSTTYQYTNKDTQKNISLEKDKISISKFDVAYREKRISGSNSADNSSSGYLTAAQMKEFMQSAIISNLKSAGVYADNGIYKYEVSVDASRNFMAFSTDKYAGLEVHKIDIKVFKDGNLFAQKLLQVHDAEGAMALVNSGGTINCGHNRGFVDNLGTVAKTITAQKGNSDEIRDVEYCSASIANTMKELGK